MLRWSEQYARTDMVYLAKGGFWLSFAQVVASFSSLILAVAFANLIAPEVYGTYRYVLSIVGILVIGTFPGLNMSAITGVAKGDEMSFWQLVKKKALWSLASTAVAAVTTIYYLINGNFLLASAVAIAAVAVPLLYTSGMYAALLNGRKNFQLLAKLAITSRIVTTTSLVITLFFTDNVFALIVVYFLPEIFLQSIFLFFLHKNRPDKRESASGNDKLARFGFHLSMMEILKTIASQIDKILVFHYLGAAQLAAYAIATTAPGQIKGLMQNMTTLALPKFSNSKSEDIGKTLPGKLFRLELIIVAVIILYWIIAPLVFPIIFPKYINAIFISQVYALSLLFFPRTFLSTAMTAHMKQKEMYKIRILAPALRIAIFAIALPIWGIWGAVIGSIIGNALTAGIYQYFFKKAFVTSTKVDLQNKARFADTKKVGDKP